MSSIKVVTPVEQFWHKVPGGVARATMKTIEAMGVGVDLIGVAARHKQAPAAFDISGIDVHHLPLPRPILYRQWLNERKPSVDYLDPDVVWASSMIPPTTERPIVSTVHDLEFLVAPERLSRRGQRFFPRAWAETASRSKVIVTPSRWVAEQVRKQLPGGEQLEVVSIPWGVSAGEAVSPDVEAEVDAMELHDEFILWVGTLEPRKNLSRLMEAFEASQAKQLLVVGPDGWGPDLSPAQANGVRLLGQVSDSVLDVLYKRAQAFVFPSLAEGFGLPVLEAMVRGTPVVCSQNSALGEIADGAAVLVDPADIDSISGGIDSVLSSGELQNELREAGMRRAAEHPWSTTAFGYEEVFATAMRMSG